MLYHYILTYGYILWRWPSCSDIEMLRVKSRMTPWRTSNLVKSIPKLPSVTTYALLASDFSFKSFKRALFFVPSFFPYSRSWKTLVNIIRLTWPDFFWMKTRSVYSDHTLNALFSSSSTLCCGKFRGYLLILYVSFFTRHLEPVTKEAIVTMH